MKALKYLILIFSLFIYSNTIAQDTLISENVDNYKIFDKTSFGPNSRHYVFAYQTFNFFTPSVYGDQYSINYLKSIDYY